MKFSTFVILLLISIAIYSVVRIAPGYIHDMQIQSVTDIVAKMYAEPTKRADVENFLIRKFQDMKLPITRDDVKIEDNEVTVRVYVDWTHEAKFIPKNQFVPAFSRHYKFHEETIEKLKQ